MGSPGGQVFPQDIGDGVDLGHRDVFSAGVREVGVAGTVVHRRDAEGGEAGDVGPAVFGADPAARGPDELGGGRRG